MCPQDADRRFARGLGADEESGVDARGQQRAVQPEAGHGGPPVADVGVVEEQHPEGPVGRAHDAVSAAVGRR